MIIGHSFIVYKSYINDSLDFSGLTGGYIIINNNIREVYYERVEPGLYIISSQESVSYRKLIGELLMKIYVGKKHMIGVIK